MYTAVAVQLLAATLSGCSTVVVCTKLRLPHHYTINDTSVLAAAAFTNACGGLLMLVPLLLTLRVTLQRSQREAARTLQLKHI
jgi:hypothetical protein